MLIDSELVATQHTWLTELYIWPPALKDGQQPTWLWRQVSLPLKTPILQDITQNIMRQHNNVIDREHICL